MTTKASGIREHGNAVPGFSERHHAKSPQLRREAGLTLIGFWAARKSQSSAEDHSGWKSAFFQTVMLPTLVVALAFFAADLPQRSYWYVPAIRDGKTILWNEPSGIERRDLRYGIGGARLRPRPPFTMLKQDKTGTTPKVLVRDGSGRKWSVKFGKEVIADVFGSRLAWTLGYYAEPTYYVANGTFRNAVPIKGLEDYVDAAGLFRHARFQLRAREPEYLSDVGWSWSDNPFVGTPQLRGLKLLMMLLSNWDDKDITDAEKRGSNNAIYRDGTSYIFFVNDWGASLGGWGRGPTKYVWYVTRSKSDCGDFTKDTRKFVKIDDDGHLEWGYKGRHSDVMFNDITKQDITWLLRYLGRLTDVQLRTGLLASGATEPEAACYTEALRSRIADLAAVVASR